MNRMYLLFLMLQAGLLQAPAQTITSFLFDPVAPTAVDTVRIYIQCDFTSGGCNGVASLNGINGNIINADALHCMGSLTVLCTDWDTLVIPPLLPGQYTLIFVLRTGITNSCDPHIIPVVIDSTQFVVLPAVQVQQLGQENLLLIPNPLTADAEVTLKWPVEFSDPHLYILDLWGRKIYSESVAGQPLILKRRLFVAGLYFYLLSDGRRVLSSGKLVVE